MHAIFVFGTLKAGFPNSDANRGARIAGEFLTSKRYPLYLVGGRYTPWLVHSEGEGFQVRGQVYLVDDAALGHMDRLERVQASNGYRRVKMSVISESTDTEMQVFVYVKSPQQLEDMQIQLGPIAEYELQHASLYQRRDS